MLDFITEIYIALYPIAPGFFKIFGFDSGVILSFVFILSYLICKVAKRQTLVVSRKFNKYIVFTVLLLIIPMIAHGEYSRVVRTIAEYGLITLLLIDYYNSTEKIEKGIHIVVITATILCFFGIYESFFKKSLFEPLFNGSSTDLGPDLQMRGSFARCETTFGQSITYAVYLSMVDLLCSYLIFKRNEKKYIFNYILILVNLILTISRAPIILFVICQLLLLASWGYKTFIKAIFKLVTIVALMLILLYFFSRNTFDNISKMFTIVAAIFSDEAAQKVGSSISNANPFIYRLELFNVIPPYIEKHPFIGNGGKLSITFSMLGHRYYSIDNSYLTWLVRYGIIGLAGHLLFFIIMFVDSFKAFRKHELGAVSFFICLNYFLNLWSVAQMAEYKLWIVLVVLQISYFRRLEK